MKFVKFIIVLTLAIMLASPSAQASSDWLEKVNAWATQKNVSVEKHEKLGIVFSCSPSSFVLRSKQFMTLALIVLPLR